METVAAVGLTGSSARKGQQHESLDDARNCFCGGVLYLLENNTHDREILVVLITICKQPFCRRSSPWNRSRMSIRFCSQGKVRGSTCPAGWIFAMLANKQITWSCTWWKLAAGVVHANVGQKVIPHNPSLRLFLYHFLHMMVSWRHESIHNNTNNQQTPPPWWWSHSPLQRREFDDTMPPEWWAALRIHFLRPLLKGLVKFNKLM